MAEASSARHPSTNSHDDVDCAFNVTGMSTDNATRTDWNLEGEVKIRPENSPGYDSLHNEGQGQHSTPLFYDVPIFNYGQTQSGFENHFQYHYQYQLNTDFSTTWTSRIAEIWDPHSSMHRPQIVLPMDSFSAPSLTPNCRSRRMDSDSSSCDSINVLPLPLPLPLLSTVAAVTSASSTDSCASPTPHIRHGSKAQRIVVDGNISYTIQKTKELHLAQEEVCVYLVPNEMDPTGTTPAPIGLAPAPISIRMHVIHSGGSSFLGYLQKLDGNIGIKCTFKPFSSGKYCIMILIEGDPQGPARGLLCPKTEVDVCRNYHMESRNGPRGPISLQENEEKYWGIASDRFSDTLFVSDRGQSAILALDPHMMQPFLKFGQNEPDAGSLYRPAGLVVDAFNKRILICDKDNHRVVVYSLDGKYVSSFGRKGHGPGEFNYPWDVDVSPTGDLIAVSDSRNHRIQFFDRYGNFLKSFCVFETEPFEYKKKFDYPRGLVFSLNGRNVFVTDFNNHKVLRVDVETLTYRAFGNFGVGFQTRPQGLTIDEFENLLVCDSKKKAVRVMTNEGVMLSTVHRIGRTQLQYPVDACTLVGGKIAVLGINGQITFM